MRTKSGSFCLTIAIILAALPLGAADAVAQEAPSVVPQDVFDGMRAGFDPAAARGVHAGYQWILSGPNGGTWWITVSDGSFKMGKGTIPNPDVTFRVSDKDWVAISNGTLSGFRAFITRRLRISGNRQLARSLGKMFP
jgi:alkyl sulfatase BDS1-like metallo-beta-lactamase superfamily hydrolase